MGALNQRSKIKAPAPQIRIERVPVEKPKPKPKPAPAAHADGSHKASPTLLQNRAKVKSKSASPYPSSTDESRRAKRKAAGGAGSRSPASENVKFDSDDTDGADDGADDMLLGARRKKRRLTRVDPNRNLRHPCIWTGTSDDREQDKEKGGELRIIHAAELANLKDKCKPAFALPDEELAIELRYPGARQRERYVRSSRYALARGAQKLTVVVA